MFKRLWNYVSDENNASSGITVLSSIVVSCAGLVIAFIV